MTKDEINRRIAEVCGWSRVLNDGEGNYVTSPTGPYWRDPLGCAGRSIRPPNYHDSLDAMHEAEKVLDNRHTIWIEHLFRIRGGREHNTLLDLFLKSTAAQRAESFLLTIGKWEGGGV